MLWNKVLEVYVLSLVKMSIARVGNSLTEIQPPLNIKHDIMIE